MHVILYSGRSDAPRLQQQAEDDPRAEDEHQAERHRRRAEHRRRGAVRNEGEDPALDRRSGRTGRADGNPGDRDQHHPDRTGRAECNRGASRPPVVSAFGRGTALGTVRHQRFIMVHRSPADRSGPSRADSYRCAVAGDRACQAMTSVSGRAPSIFVNVSGTGYLPSTKFRIAACCSSTGSIVAAVLMPAGADTTLIASR